MSVLAQGFLLGLAMAPACIAACAPVFVPVLLSREDARLKSHAFALGEFLCGRFVAYAAVGLLIGWLGARMEGAALRWASVIAYALLGVALLLVMVIDQRVKTPFVLPFYGDAILVHVFSPVIGLGVRSVFVYLHPIREAVVVVVILTNGEPYLAVSLAFEYAAIVAAACPPVTAGIADPVVSGPPPCFDIIAKSQ